MQNRRDGRVVRDHTVAASRVLLSAGCDHSSGLERDASLAPSGLAGLLLRTILEEANCSQIHVCPLAA